MYKSQNWKAEIFIKDFNTEKNIISVGKTVEKHKEIIPSILLLHAMTGIKMFGIGKGKGLNVIKQCPLLLLGEEGTSENRLFEESK